jgi:hypothetical protein
MGYKWTPLWETTVDPSDYLNPKYLVFAEISAKDWGCSVEEAAGRLAAYDAKCQYWRNDLYQVQMRRFFNKEWQVEMVHLNIRRIDGAPIFDWRHRQWIKNQLVGRECEGFELYPAESRLSDEVNKYHVWVLADPSIRIPVEAATGERMVQEEEVKGPAGLRQRGY